MVRLQDQLASFAIAQLFLILGSAAQIPFFPDSHTEGYKFDPLLYVSYGSNTLSALANS
jgi:hypothetical protein